MESSSSDRITIEWNKLSYTVKKTKINWFKLKRSKEYLEILKSVSGSVHSGQLVAVIGPSGAGKTTFLAAVSQRLRGRISGSVLVNGEEVNRSEMAKSSSFVPQFDITSDNLTVMEQMNFVYQLKSCTMYGPRKEYISGILQSLGLHTLLNSRIKNLSGGERKKLALASELMVDPSIVFCDEPTTGLDSSNALSVVSSLEQLVGKVNNAIANKPKRNGIKLAKNKLVICSIHQPSSQVFACFSHIILMQDGQIAFQGTTMKAESYFAGLGLKCSAFSNRADFFVKTLMEHVIAKQKQNLRFSGEASGIYSKRLKPNGEEQETTISKYQSLQVSWFYQVFILIKRLGLEYVGMMNESAFRMATLTFTALLVGIVYAKTDDNDQKSIQDINGLIITVVFEIVFTSAYNIVFYYPSKMPILRRETGEKLYSLSAFYVAYLICTIPKSLVECFLFLGIVFPFISYLNGFWMFFKIGLALTMFSISANAYGLMLSGFFESSSLATSLAPPIDITLVLFGGVYIQLKTMWFLKYVSFFFYAMESFSIIVYSEIGALNCTSQYFCMKSGEDVLISMSYGTTYNTLYMDYAGLIGSAAVMSSIGFLGVNRMVNKIGYY